MDEELRTSAREAATAADLMRLLASLVRAGSLSSSLVERPIFKLLQRPGSRRLLRHPWPEKKGRVENGGVWWSVGPGRWRKDWQDGRIYIQPTTDDGCGWSNPNRSYPFDTLDELFRWLEPRLVEWKVADPQKRRRRRRTREE